MTAELDQLADIPAARARLDERELELIDRARHAGATWAEIGGALGLGSRQAAEQRRQRLGLARQTRWQRHDLDYPASVAALRAAVTDLRRWIGADRRWDARFRRAALVRRTAEAAADAPAGALHTLATHISADLAGAQAERLPTPVRAIAATLDRVLSTIH